MKIKFAEIVFIVMLSIVIFSGVVVVYSFLTGNITFSKFVLGLALVAIAFCLSFLIYEYFVYFEPIMDQYNRKRLIRWQHKKEKVWYSYIEIRKWKNWEHSYWIRFVQDGQSVIIDSSVIDELHDKLKFIPLVKGFEIEKEV